jgi:hypothetical protein
MAQGFGRDRLRARLLVGVATVALAAPAAGKAVAQEAKWQPWLEAGGMVGTDHSFGDVDMFIPVWQDQTSLLFGDLRGKFSTEPTQEGNFGLGYRTQIDPEWILGGYGYFDIQNSKNDNLFYQATLGLEALSVDWDFRLNGYIPINSGGQDASGGKGDLQINGNTIGITHDVEKPLYGFDGEVGWRLPIFPADGDVDVRAFIGGYYFANSDVDTVAGPRGRLEVRLYDIDILGTQSRLTINGEIQWDQPRGTQAFGGLELRIPLGTVTGTPGPKLSPLDRRMVDRVQRDVDIVTGTFQSDPKDVVVDELTVKTHTIVFAQEGAPDDASGTKGDPISLNSAVARAEALGNNAIIVVEGGSSGIVVDQPLQLASGQALLGGGSHVPLSDGNGHSTNFNVPGARPTLLGTNVDANLIQMASGSQNEVFGLNLAGDFSNGVAAVDMERAIVKQTAIDGSDPGVGNGIYVRNNGGVSSAFIHLENNTITGMSENGILVVNGFYDLGGSFSQTIRIDDNTIVGVGRHGIAMYTGVYSASLQQTFGIGGNTISGANNIGILLDTGERREALVAQASASGPTELVQSGAVYGNRISDVGEDGIRANTRFSGLGNVVTQALAITGNSIDSVGQDGIRVSSSFYNVGTVSQAIAIQSNTVTNFAIDGIDLDTIATGRFLSAGQSSVLAQTFAIDQNVVDPPAASHDGIHVDSVFRAAEGSGGLLVNQQGQISGNVISDTAFAGIEVATYGRGQLLNLSQSVLVAGNSVLTPGSFGILFDAEFTDVGNVSQLFGISANTVTGALIDGIAASTRVFAVDGQSATVSQGFAIDGNQVSDSGEVGILVRSLIEPIDNSDNFVRFTQSGEINGNTVTGAGSDGIHVYTGAFAASSASAVLSQTLTINDNVVSDVDQNEQLISGAAGGIVVDNRILGHVSASQGLTIDPNTVFAVSNGGDGIVVYTSVAGGSVTQAITIASNTVLGGLDGIRVRTVVGYASFGTDVSQALQITGNSVAGPERNGIEVYNHIENTGHGSVGLSQSAFIAGNLVSDTGEVGILVHSTVYAIRGTLTPASGSANLSQILDIASNQVLSAGGDGIAVQTYAFAVSVATSNTQAAIVSQGLTIAGNTVVDAGWDGIWVNNEASTYRFEGTPGIVQFRQTASIVGNSVTGSRGELYGGDGIDVDADISNIPGGSITFSQSLAINDNLLSGNAGNGILVRDFVASEDSAGPISFTQAILIDPNTVVGNGSDGIGIATNLYGHGVDGATQSISIAANRVSGSGRDGIYVGTFLTSVAASQTVVIAGNTVAGSGADGIGVRNDLAGFYRNQFDYPGNADLTQALTIAGNSIAGSGDNGIHLDNQIVTSNEDHALLQTGSISGNTITDSGTNGVLIANSASSEFADAPTIGQTLAVTANRIDGVAYGHSSSIVTGGNAILVQNDVSRFATLNQSLTIAQNSITRVAYFDGIYIRTVVSGEGAQASQQFTITSNSVSGSGGYGVAIRTLASNGGSATQSFAVVGNSLVNNVYGGVKVFASAGQSGTIVQVGSIAGNTLTGATANFGEGIDGVAVAGEDGSVTQTVDVSGNVIASNAVGVYLRAGDRGALTSGTVSQTWSFTNNSVSANTARLTSSGVALGGHGIYAVNAGADSLQTITLVSGNVIAGNQQDGVRFVNRAGTQSATLHSNLGSGAVLNTITSNGTNFFATSTGGTQLISK